MKKSIPIFMTALAVESSLLFSMPDLTGWQGVPLWCGGGILALLICGTSYFLFSKLADWKEEQVQNRTRQNQEFQNSSNLQLKELIETVKKMQSDHEAQMKSAEENQKTLLSKMNSSFTSQLNTLQNQLSQSAAHTDEVQAETQKLYQTSIAQLQDNQQMHSQMLAENQKNLISEITEIFTSKVNEMQEQLKEVLQFHYKTQTEKLVKSNQSLLSETESKITEWNQNLLENQKANFDTITGEICQIYKNHITKLSTQTQQSFITFADTTNDALSQNIQQTKMLADTEQKFIAELSDYQTKLQNLISQNAADYTQATQNISVQLGEKIQQMFTQSSEENAHHMQNLTEFQKFAANTLSGQIADYTDSLVQKSAQAIAEVQSDNNQKLQQTAEYISQLAQTTGKFTGDSLENVKKIENQIDSLMQQHNSFLLCLQKVETDNVNNISQTMQKKLETFSDIIHKLNVEQVALFDETMQNYREKFVQANADSLAAVQSDSNQVISETYQKMGTLSEEITKTENHIQQVSDNLIQMSSAIRSIIEDGNESLRKQQEEHHENMEEMMGKKLDEYNSTFRNMKKTIQDIYAEIQCNTEQYQKMLEEIHAAQNAMNSLTEQDIHLLEGILK